MEARKAWIPVAVQALTPELADKLGVAGRPGVRVTRVFGGGAAKAGLEVGDLILSVDGDPVEASQPSEADVFETMIRQYKIGSTVTLTTMRGKEERPVKVQLESSPRLPREMKKYRGPELRVPCRAMSPRWTGPQMAVAPGEKGVLVEAVREGGWAALAHLGDGDVILSIDGSRRRRRCGAEGEDGEHRGGQTVVGGHARAPRLPDVLRRDADGVGAGVQGCGGVRRGADSVQGGQVDWS